MKETVVAALGAVGFFALGLATEAFRSWQARSAADRERKEQRRLERQDRRDAFELETLLKVEAALEAYVLFQTDRLGRRKAILNARGVWRDNGDKDETVAGLLTFRELDRLVWRIFNQQIREKVLEVEQDMGKVFSAPPPGLSDDEVVALADANYGSATKALFTVDRMISDRIRELHEEPVA